MAGKAAVGFTFRHSVQAPVQRRLRSDELALQVPRQPLPLGPATEPGQLARTQAQLHLRHRQSRPKGPSLHPTAGSLGLLLPPVYKVLPPPFQRELAAPPGLAHVEKSGITEKQGNTASMTGS